MSVALALMLGVGACGSGSTSVVETGSGQAGAGPTVSRAPAVGGAEPSPGSAARTGMSPSPGSTLPQSPGCESFGGESDHKPDFEILQIPLADVIDKAEVVLTGEFVGSPRTHIYELPGPGAPVPEGMTTTYNPALPDPGPITWPVTDFVFKVDRVLAISQAVQAMARSASPETFTVRHLGELTRRCSRLDPRPVIGVKYLLFGSQSDANHNITEEYRERESQNYGDGGFVIYASFNSMVGRYIIGPGGQLLPEPGRYGIPAAALNDSPVRRAVAAAGQEGLMGELGRSFRK